MGCMASEHDAQLRVSSYLVLLSSMSDWVDRSWNRRNARNGYGRPGKLWTISRLRVNGEIAQLLFTPLIDLLKQRVGFDPFHIYQTKERYSGIS